MPTTGRSSCCGAESVLVVCEPGDVRVFADDGRETTAAWPDVRRMGRATGSLETVLDGVIAEVDGDGRPTGRVDGIAERLVEGSANRWRRLAQKHPVAFLAFDLLWLEGHPVTDLAWSARDVSCSMRSACTGPPGKHPRSIGATRTR